MSLKRVRALFSGEGGARRFQDPAPVLAEIARLRLPANTRILDFGCGAGQTTLDIAAAYRDAEVVGLDVTPAQIERAERARAASGISNVRFLEGDGGDVSGEFDLILLLAVIQFVAKPRPLLRELREHLRPGGTLLFTTVPLPSDEPGHSFTRAVMGRFIPETPTWLTLEAWDELLFDVGFTRTAYTLNPWRLRELPPQRAETLAEELRRYGLELEQVEPWIQIALITAR